MRTFATALSIASLIFLTGCGDSAKLPEQASTGPNPPIPEPSKSVLPTVNIAPAKGWRGRRQADRGRGLAVTAFATGSRSSALALLCCRTATCWSPRPTRRERPEEGKGIKGWVMTGGAEAGRRRRAERQPHHAAARRRRRRRAGDADRVSRRPQLAVRHGAGRQRSLRRQHRCGDALPLRRTARHRSRRPATKVADLPGRPDQSSLDQERHRQSRRLASSM